MGNQVSNATKGKDGFYYWQYCIGDGCPPPERHYRVYNKHASKVPVIADPNAGYILVNEKVMEESIRKDRDGVLYGLYYLDHNDSVSESTLWYGPQLPNGMKPPEGACLRIDPCNGVVADEKMCCASTKPLNISLNTFQETPSIKKYSTRLSSSQDVKSEEETQYMDTSKQNTFRSIIIVSLLAITCLLIFLCIVAFTFFSNSTDTVR